MKKLISVLILIFFCSLFNSSSAKAEKNYFSSREKLAINKITANNEQVGVFELFELTIGLSAAYDNPFDPQDIELTARFITPTARQISVPGFFYQDYTRKLVNGGVEELKKKDTPVWKVRFAPQEAGAYQYFIILKDRSGQVSSKKYVFTTVKSGKLGFIRVNQNNPQWGYWYQNSLTHCNI